jgi:hypothetical protein
MWEMAQNEGFPPTRQLALVAAKVSLGASTAVPAAKGERPLWVRSRDLRGRGRERARCADSGRSLSGKQSAGAPPSEVTKSPSGAIIAPSYYYSLPDNGVVSILAARGWVPGFSFEEYCGMYIVTMVFATLRAHVGKGTTRGFGAMRITDI